MSGWIKMSTGLRDHPKVVRMAGMLKSDCLRVVGALHAVWSVFDEHSPDGLLEFYTLRVMDDKIGWRGFCQAMQSVGWLIESESGLQAPDYEEHNGPSAKRRAMDASRKQDARKADKCPDPVREMSASDADNLRTREEKRREEEKTSLLPQAPARPSAEPPLSLVEVSRPPTPGDCPHGEILALWAEVLPHMPQHQPEHWRGARADHLRTRWRETAAAKKWPDKAHGLAYFRRLFAYVGQSEFLTGRSRPPPGKKPFVIELEWLVLPSNWAKVHEGKYHAEEATA